METPSKKYTLNKADLIEIAQVIGWTVASTVVAVLIATLQEVNVPAQYALLVPIVNSALYALKKFIEERKDTPVRGV